MDLQVTTQMLTSRDIKVLHLEPTDLCQAACPQCARETDRHFDRNRNHSLTLEQLDRLLPAEIVQGLDKMFMCGNYGDPVACHHTLAIYRWFRNINPGVVLGMNTNGALQNTFWWHELATIMDQPRDYVVFSIDGLEDSNTVYRVNVKWSKLMANAESFIAAGGSAHWDMLVYQHNQHQVDACEKLARNMGFKWFRAKVSRRPMTGRLQAPINWQNPMVSQGDIQCRALAEQSIYIDAHGRVSPCCWLGSRQQEFITDFKTIQAGWGGPDAHPVCSSTCRADDRGTSFDNQWQREVQLC